MIKDASTDYRGDYFPIWVSKDLLDFLTAIPDFAKIQLTVNHGKLSRDWEMWIRVRGNQWVREADEGPETS